jgi:two-component system phosphate regulon sensor histidine kinase PhoR
MHSGQPVIISGSGKQKIKTAYLVQSLIYVPINVKGHTIGVLGVDNRTAERSFSKHDLYLLSALADYAAIALENARLFGEAEGERRRLGAILGGLTEPVIVTSSEDSQVVLINDAALRAFNLKSDGVEGSPLVELLDNDDLLNLIAQSASDGEETLTTEVPLEDGRTLHASVTSIPAVGKVIVMQDITHLKELDRMKSDFVSTVSHDLRSPLTSIKGYAEMLQMIGELNEQQEEFTRRIVGGVHRITELIEDLLDIGRIESGVDWTMSPCQMTMIAEEVVSDLQGGAQTRKQTVSLEHPAELPIVTGNAVRLRQALSNLISNAIKYTPEGGTINVRLRQEGGQILIQVQDNGIGIAETDLPYVFDKFYRVKSRKTEMISGTGLGLSIAKSIVEKHQGRIWVESEVDKGTTFSFTLPAVLPSGKKAKKPVAVQETPNPL